MRIPLGQKQNKNHEQIILSEQILQRLPIAFAQIKAGNTSQNLLNETLQLVHLLSHQRKPQKYIEKQNSFNIRVTI